ncbi:MAG: alpha-glucan family phosphorylase, partial [Candidatus Nanoarchaeia archaeon]|nr:alpha-glucan family phosphorylase [Candidatus Jingweiarchaeum tengchongense]
VLGIGGVRMLEALGFRIKKYHMNEGHCALLALELLYKNGTDVDKVRESCIFTTHTPVEAAHDKFSYELISELLGEADLSLLKKYGGQDKFNMTLFALNMSNYVNGVAQKHREVVGGMFPGYTVHAITNGVHSYTWTCDSFKRIFNKYLPGWANEPDFLVRVDVIPEEEIWHAHQEAKKNLIDYVNNVTNINMDYNTFTMGFARRATGYKRATFLFSDPERLKKINRRYKMQLIFAGKAHPKDDSGKRIIAEIFDHIKKLKDEIKIVYLPNYDLDLALKFVSGVDVWLNTPLRPLEASGTSGMKAAHNGVINFSVLDGWWVEGCIENVTGWAIGPHPNENLSSWDTYIREKDDLYNKLEYVILPMFYNQRDAWIQMMKNSIGKIAYYFNSHRMMRRYVTEAYL